MRKIAFFSFSVFPILTALDIFGAGVFALSAYRQISSEFRHSDSDSALREGCYDSLESSCFVRQKPELFHIKAQNVALNLKGLGFRFASNFDLMGFAETLIEAESKYGVAHEILIAVAAVESSFDSKALSPKDARGLFQILPTTAAYLWPEFIKTLSKDDPIYKMDPLKDLEDPRLSTLLGAYYLSKLDKTFKGRTHLALASYNAGPGAVQRNLKEGKLISSEYIFKVYAVANDYREKLGSL